MADDIDRITARWQAEVDETDRRLALAIDDICKRAGGINDYPTPLAVRQILEQHGLLVRRR